MYPSPATPYYGAFVKSHVERLEQDPRFRVRVAAIRDPRKGWLRSPWKYGSLFTDLVRELAQFRPHVVHYHYALPTALLGPAVELCSGIRYAITLHGGDLWEMPQRIPKGATLLRHVLSHASHLIVVSEAMAHDLTQFMGEEPRRLSVINMGIDTTRFVAAPPASPARLLVVGQLIARKGGDIAIRALAEARRAQPDLGLTFVGAGPERSTWEQLARNLGVGAAVQFAGVVAPEAMPHVMAEHGTLLVPSRREPLGLVALEGMAVGLTVIASRTGGLAELIHDRDNGILVTPEDPGALAQAILLTQATSQSLRTTMQERAHLTAQANDVSHKVREVAEILLRIGRGTGIE